MSFAHSFFYISSSLSVAWFATQLLFAYLLNYVTVTQHAIIHMHRCTKISTTRRTALICVLLAFCYTTTREPIHDCYDLCKVSEKQSKPHLAKCNSIVFISSPFEQLSCKNKTETIMQQLPDWLKISFVCLLCEQFFFWVLEIVWTRFVYDRGRSSSVVENC